MVVVSDKTIMCVVMNDELTSCGGRGTTIIDEVLQVLHMAFDLICRLPHTSVLETGFFPLLISPSKRTLAH